MKKNIRVLHDALVEVSGTQILFHWIGLKSLAGHFLAGFWVREGLLFRLFFCNFYLLFSPSTHIFRNSLGTRFRKKCWIKENIRHMYCCPPPLPLIKSWGLQRRESLVHCISCPNKSILGASGINIMYQHIPTQNIYIYIYIHIKMYAFYLYLIMAKAIVDIYIYICLFCLPVLTYMSVVG